jgi:hypothetical protein
MNVICYKEIQQTEGSEDNILLSQVSRKAGFEQKRRELYNLE